MIAVIFEVQPKAGQGDRYFEIAAELKSELVKIDGFVGVERFESVSEKGKFLSLSFFRDEAAAANWRTHINHRKAQTEGRETVFAHYRIRVAEVIRDYSMTDRTQAPLSNAQNVMAK